MQSGQSREAAMKSQLSPTGEDSNHKSAAVFDTIEEAEKAQAALLTSSSLDPQQIDVLSPDSENQGRRLLPESQGIWRTWLRAHAVFGVIGAIIGMLSFAVLYAAGVTVITDNPLLAGIMFFHVPTMMGLLIGGLFTIRPDQASYLYTARDALKAGKFVIVVHAHSPEQLDAARKLLEGPALETARTA